MAGSELLSHVTFDDDKVADFIDDWGSDADYIIAHTSGSTGAPKQIRLLKSDMLASARATNSFFDITAESTLVCPLSVDYIAGKMMVVRAIASGARLFMERPSNRPINRRYGQIDLLPVVPSQLPSILANEPLHRDIKALLVGGAAVNQSVEDELLAAGINAYVSYGMTETCSHVALRHVGEECYTALDHVSFDADPRGCLVVKLQGVSMGRLVTNDVVRLVDDKRFIWLGRYDNVINSGGVKVMAEDIERKIARALPAATAYYVTSRPDDKWGETPVIVAERGDYSPADALTAARQLTTGAERPADIVVVDHIKRLPNGKIVRERL